MMVVSAASISTSLTPAASVWPTGCAGVDLDFEVQAVVLQQDRGRRRGIAVEADQLCVVAQAGVAAAFKATTSLPSTIL